MKIAVIGTGYVGLPTGACFAELGNNVACIDTDADKIESLKKGRVTFFENGLEELLIKNSKNKTLVFTTSMDEGLKGAEVIILAVGTPPEPITKEADMQYVYAAARQIAPYIQDYTVVATKSTVPVGTGDIIEKIIRENNPNADFDVVSLPEFLREGYAVHDFFNPDRIVIGINSERAANVIKKLYEPFHGKTNLLIVDRLSSELIKYASNAFLAIKLHYVNEIADLCEVVGADISAVTKGIGFDSRIGHKFLNPGPSFGGSCFPKDISAIYNTAKKHDVELSLIGTSITGNENRRKKMAQRISFIMDGRKKLAVWGLAFKDGTDDCRESPAIDIISYLISEGIDVTAYDPKAANSAKKILGDSISYADDAYQAAKGADALAILTEWKEFKQIDLNKINKLLNEPNIIDLRNILDPETVAKEGFNYYSIGRKDMVRQKI